MSKLGKSEARQQLHEEALVKLMNMFKTYERKTHLTRDEVFEQLCATLHISRIEMFKK